MKGFHMKLRLMHGDCMELIKDLPDKSVDMILSDLPYATTKNKWDIALDLDELWEGYKRVITDRDCIALFAQTPFDKVLGASNLQMLKYEWVWEKAMATGRLNCNFAPMKAHENILVFSKSAACYVKDSSRAMAYHPQMGEGKPYRTLYRSVSTNYDTKWQRPVETINSGTRYPRSVLKFPHDKEKLHPTQKPVALLEYLIRTYTQEGETVLDNCMGSGSTGVAAVQTGRNFIGMEIDQHYFDIAKERIERSMQNGV